MMTIECAVSKAVKACRRLDQLIQANESSWQCMDWRNRGDMGMLRCFMHNAGVPKDQLPEMPFLEPAHLEAYNRRQEAHRAEMAKCEG